MKKKAYILTVLISLTLFLVAFTPMSGSQNVEEYNPWLDVTDDGYGGIDDVVAVAEHFGALGTPVTKAAIAYDSGWLNITDKQGEFFSLVHNLNTTDAIVDIVGKQDPTSGCHKLFFGATYYIQGWNHTYGGSSDDRGFSVVETSDGGFAIAGFTGSFGAGSWDVWLVKTDSSGVVEWTRTYGGSSNDYGLSVVETVDGGFAIAGHTWSFGAGGSDVWLVKTCVELGFSVGLSMTNFTNSTITFYRGSKDPYWNHIRVLIFKIKESP